MYDRTRGDSGRTTKICVDSYAGGVPVGRFYNYGQGSIEPFQSLTQLLVGMEHALDHADLPQSFTAIRSFSPPSEPQTDPPTEQSAQDGALATFAVKVLFRQHTSWQGAVFWKEQQTEQPFRSALELILLMDSALNSSQKSQPNR